MYYKPSYYNLLVDHHPLKLLFNGVSSALLQLPSQMADELLPFLGQIRSRQAGAGLSKWEYPTFQLEQLPLWAKQRFDELLEGSFFVPAVENEQQSLKERYLYCRRNSPLMVTITTTMDCNLGCYYCYEDKSKQYLSKSGCDAILQWICKKVDTKQHEKVFIDWYGGEPMLNQEAINYFSSQAIQFCEGKDLTYVASMISNGTRWPPAAKEFIARNRIRDVQFTLDGPREHHNKRRRYVDKNENPEGSFEMILDTIDRLIGSVRIYLRINVDPWIGRSAFDLLEIFEERDWLREESNFFPYLATIGPMTEQCGFLGKSSVVEGFQAEFDEMLHEFHMRISTHLDSHGMDILQYYPDTIGVNCAAVNDNSMVFGPDGKMYKCGLEVGDTNRAHDALVFDEKDSNSSKKGMLPILNSVAAEHSPDRWDKFDPFSHERCSKCQYLPICMGGCPKSQIDRNEYYLKLQSEYWENGFDRIIRNYYDASKRSLQNMASA